MVVRVCLWDEAGPSPLEPPIAKGEKGRGGEKRKKRCAESFWFIESQLSRGEKGRGEKEGKEGKRIGAERQGRYLSLFKLSRKGRGEKGGGKKKGKVKFPQKKRKGGEKGGKEKEGLFFHISFFSNRRRTPLSRKERERKKRRKKRKKKNRKRRAHPAFSYQELLVARKKKEREKE